MDPANPLPQKSSQPRELWACGHCSLVDIDVPLVAVSGVGWSTEGRLCRSCIAQIHADALRIVEELEE